jgi:hypothetical protein
MVSLKDLVEVSERVGSPTRKRERISLLANFLKLARGREITLAATYLSGQIPHGRLGIGWATIQGALEGLLVVALAGASSIPPEGVRQGLMSSGDIGEVVRRALYFGAQEKYERE